MYRRFNSVFALAVVVLVPSLASAQVIYSDDFNSDSSANYNQFITAGATGPSGDATFVYNYGAAPASGGLSIPAAPHTTDGSTIGLRVRTDNLQNSVGTVVGATEVVTKSLVLPNTYKVQVDVWSNYIGLSDLSTSGSNGSTGVAVGIGTKGTNLQYIAGNDGLLFEGFGDNGGGANQAYRVYTNATHPNPTTKGYWAAGTTTTSASNTDPYYTSLLPSVSGPAGQSTFAPTTQGGATAAGTLGFGWHTWTITNDGTNVVWVIDGKTFTTVPLADFTRAGSQVSLGNTDTGLTGNSAAANQLLNAEIFDNLTVSNLGVSGDYNGNGIVDAADYVVWRDSVGASTLNNRSSTITGTVGQADYDYWRSRFGATSGSGSGLGGAAVPEPATLALIVFGLLFGGAFGRKRRAS